MNLIKFKYYFIIEIKCQKKIYTGPKGGKYVMKHGKKKYLVKNKFGEDCSKSLLNTDQGQRGLCWFTAAILLLLNAKIQLSPKIKQFLQKSYEHFQKQEFNNSCPLMPLEIRKKVYHGYGIIYRILEKPLLYLLI